MAECPVCLNSRAEISGSFREAGGAGTTRFVKCPDCPTNFVIPGTVWTLQSTNKIAFERRRAQWAEMLRLAAARGESVTKLY